MSTSVELAAPVELPVVAAPDAATLANNASVKRMQMITILSVNIPPPRVRTHFLAELARLNKLSPNTAPTADSAVRLSPDANAALATLASKILDDIIVTSMDNALEAGVKRVRIEHLFARDPKLLSSFPLIRDILSTIPISEPAVDHVAEAAADAADAAAAPAVAVLPEDEAAEDAADAAAEDAADAASDSSVATAAGGKLPKFDTYVGRAFGKLKLTDKYKSLMLTQDFKEYLSLLIIKYIQFNVPLCAIFIEAMDLKTIKSKIILRIVKFLLSQLGRLDLYPSYQQLVDAKVELVKNFDKTLLVLEPKIDHVVEAVVAEVVATAVAPPKKVTKKSKKAVAAVTAVDPAAVAGDAAVTTVVPA